MNPTIIEELRKKDVKILVSGNHVRIIQSILDFDYAGGKETPSVVGIVAGGRKTQKFFWGDGEVLIPVFATMEGAQIRLKNTENKPDFLFNITSAGSTPSMVTAFFDSFPLALGAHLFAEGVSERDALLIIEKYGKDKLIAGPSGVGFCIPGHLKLGAIGGVLGERIAKLGSTKGEVAVVCSSGGMVNELMYQIVAAGSGISFAVAFGGDRFPVTSPLQWITMAQNDSQTKEIVYFGELGGRDEYELIEAIKDKKITKPIFAYIAGRFESKDEKIQFGHAKALAKTEDETAQAKMAALRSVGVNVAETFTDFMTTFTSLSKEVTYVESARDWKLRSGVSRGTHFSAPKYKHTAQSTSFTESILMRILQKKSVSHETVAFVEAVFSELIDHGPHVSGAVNTIITTRAGRDMGSALATGVLTVGDRFGGAMNNAGKIWFECVSHGTTAQELVSLYSKKREYIPGIGHKKYTIYKPDPRVAELITLGKAAITHPKHLLFAEEVARETSKKRDNLILNVDGTVAALFLDYLEQKEMFDVEHIQELLDIEFFNALFIIPRSVGFIGHYLDQKRIDEGLFRLGDQDVFEF
jgi:ATP citrate (pro-S)-lyase